MNYNQELQAAEIIAGTKLVKCTNRRFFVIEPTTEEKYLASLIYKENYEDAKSIGIFDEDEILLFTVDNGFWSIDEENRLARFIEDVSTLRIKIYEVRGLATEREMVRTALYKTIDEIESLLTKKNSYQFLTCDGVANLARTKFLMGCSLFSTDGKKTKFWKNPLVNWEKSPHDSILEEAIIAGNQNNPTDKDIRAIARSENWKNIWESRKSGMMIFPCSTVNLNESQKKLIRYSLMYDIISEREDITEQILNDDDVLDGWMLVQRKEMEKKKDDDLVDSTITNERVMNCEEVFIPVNNEKGRIIDPQKIFERNNVGGKIEFLQRMRQIKEQGVVQERDMIDTKQRIRMEAAQKISERIK